MYFGDSNFYKNNGKKIIVYTLFCREIFLVVWWDKTWIFSKSLTGIVRYIVIKIRITRFVHGILGCNYSLKKSQENV